jgi:hypothetical protein
MNVMLQSSSNWRPLGLMPTAKRASIGQAVWSCHFRLIAWLWRTLIRQSASIDAGVYDAVVEKLDRAGAAHRDLSVALLQPEHASDRRSAGLFYFGVALPELRRAEHWQQCGLQILLEQLPRQVRVMASISSRLRITTAIRRTFTHTIAAVSRQQYFAAVIGGRKADCAARTSVLDPPRTAARRFMATTMAGGW